MEKTWRRDIIEGGSPGITGHYDGNSFPEQAAAHLKPEMVTAGAASDVTACASTGAGAKMS